METPRLLVGAALRAPPPPPQFRHRRLPPPQLGAAHFLSVARRAPLIRCSYSRCVQFQQNLAYSRLDVEANNAKRIISLRSLLFQGTNLADEQHNGDILELFSKAQQNILHLNKKRLVAMEELKKLQAENKSLLQDIEVLETEMQGVLSEAAQSSSFSELLLRIDTMVIAGMISMTEASDIRKKVVDNRDIVQRSYSDIHLKSNTELLSELRLFMRKPIEKPFHIVHICTEMDPVASFGSLSTYIVGLSCAFQRNGNLVEVIMPKYAISFPLSELWYNVKWCCDSHPEKSGERGRQASPAWRRRASSSERRCEPRHRLLNFGTAASLRRSSGAAHFLSVARRAPLIRCSYSRCVQFQQNLAYSRLDVEANNAKVWIEIVTGKCTSAHIFECYCPVFGGLFKRIISLRSLLFQGTNLADEQRNGDILELFSKAQQNILHLNKKRLVAMEELKKLQAENKSLLQDIEVLETEMQGLPQNRYTSINENGIHGLKKSEAEYESYFGGHWHKNRIWTG
ncbi:hypothetical protein PR202_ga03230 [Eleusine coracana subsp. coracana]|uniref:starch synthase n=1 Tax=Eleusine coracana subsp. coracana TaxID=191504 RepID=A0AAV5BNK2_ELECO|nr:hypothetical protein PR202_ga03230 [Eleusine coracana subsp. coracana]